jgi:uncharacterized protein YkwD
MRRAAILLGFLAFLTGCAGLGTPEPPPLGDLLAALKEEMYVYVAQERSRLNAQAMPLRRDPLLEEAAQTHSEAMAEAGAFDAEGSDDNVAIQRLAADAVFQGFVTESSGMQYFDPALGFDPAEYAKAIIDQWVSIDAHRTNIEYERFSRSGIGVAAKGNAIYVAQLLATDLDLRND